MASGDTLFRLSGYGAIQDTSTPAGKTVRNNFPVLAYDAASDEYAQWPAYLPGNYSGGGLTFTLVWVAATATSGNVYWRLKIESNTEDVDDLDGNSFSGSNTVIAGTNATSAGRFNYDDITFSNGTDMDSWAAGEWGRIELYRDANSASDTMAGDAQIVEIICKET